MDINPDGSHGPPPPQQPDFDNIKLGSGIGGGSPMPLVGLGVASAVIPFFISVSSSSMTSVNGVVTSATYRNWPAVVCGAAAILFALIGLAMAIKSKRLPAAALAVGAIALGGYQLARGLGAFEQHAGDALGSRTETEGTSETTVAIKPTPPPAPDPASCADGQACFNLAMDLAGRQKTDAARVAFTTGCAKDPAFCNDPGVMYFTGQMIDGGKVVEGKPFPKDLAIAMKLFAAGCKANVVRACGNVGVMYRDGVGVGSDSAQALAYFEKACAGSAVDVDERIDQAGRCSSVGILKDSGKVGAADHAAAQTAFERGCELADRECHDLGVFLEADHKLARARAMYEKACDDGNDDGCTNLGVMEHLGQGGAKDPVGAKAALKLACKHGHQLACDDLKMYKLQ